MERDLQTIQIPHEVGLYISTHTLTWSVTENQPRKNVVRLISTHTLTWSVTKQFVRKQSFCRFQLTRSRGAWLLTLIILPSPEKVISTHTLTWSVTNYSMTEKGTDTFQLTRSRGAWPAKSVIKMAQKDFNSHAHVERDYTQHIVYSDL